MILTHAHTYTVMLAVTSAMLAFFFILTVYTDLHCDFNRHILIGYWQIINVWQERKMHNVLFATI